MIVRCLTALALWWVFFYHACEQSGTLSGLQ